MPLELDREEDEYLSLLLFDVTLDEYELREGYIFTADSFVLVRDGNAAADLDTRPFVTEDLERTEDFDCEG